MEPWQIALIAKPFVLLALGVFVLYPARKWTERLPEGKLKNSLLTKDPVVMTVGVFVSYALLALLVSKIN